ncbi:MAG: helix-turn-helix domain-containing protein [Candidatus Thiodiazotropha sp. (ex Troendleina suluensis)]|nr:helix-turn-helix domain-containing protein [Candidatus Thiodiazotropha sp. (ex Troendleina suluensis)]
MTTQIHTAFKNRSSEKRNLRQSSMPRVDFSLIGQCLRGKRKSLGFNQEEAAHRTGVSRQTIQRYEAGKPMDLVMLERVCHKYGILLPDLLSTQNEYNWISAAIKRLGPQAVGLLSTLCESIEANRNREAQS